MKLSNQNKSLGKLATLLIGLSFTSPIYNTFAQAPTTQVSEAKSFENKLGKELHDKLQNLCFEAGNILILPIKDEDLEENKDILKSYKSKFYRLGITNLSKKAYIEPFIHFCQDEFVKTLSTNQKALYYKNKERMKINL